MKTAHMRKGSLYAAAGCDQLGRNGHRDFFRRDGSNIETNRSVYPIEKMFLQAFFHEFAENCDRLALRANHSDITRLGLYRPAQHPHVVAMTPGYDDDIRSFCRR